MGLEITEFTKYRTSKCPTITIQYLTVLVKSVQDYSRAKRSTKIKQKSDMDIRTSEQSNQFTVKLFKFKYKLMPKTKSNCRR
jgi:hypothetical protein